VDDLALAAVTTLLASSMVGVELAIEELLLRARDGVMRRARAACLRVHAENRATLDAYAEAHGWATVFPLGVQGELQGLGVTIEQTMGLEPRTRVQAEGVARRGPMVRRLVARLSSLPYAKAELVAPDLLRVEWSAERTDPRALDLAVEALLDAVASPGEARAYR
jgi:hypothetical protein